MSVLAPTPADRLIDPSGRPYFLWDEDMSMATFVARVRDPDPDVRAYFVGKLSEFWRWLFDRWSSSPDVGR